MFIKLPSNKVFDSNRIVMVLPDSYNASGKYDVEYFVDATKKTILKIDQKDFDELTDKLTQIP